MKKALVVEGGGMRGVFSAGVLDSFLEYRFDPFDIYIGVSSGACNLSSHVAGQYERNYRLYTKQMLRPGFISVRKFLAGGHHMDLDWFWETHEREDPFDVETAISNIQEKSFLIVCTAIESGQPCYLTPTLSNWSLYLKASCAIPILYRGSIEIDHQVMIDGGVTDPIPVIEAYKRGARRIVVIRSQPPHYVKKNNIEANISAFFFRKHHSLKRALKNRSKTYIESIQFINNPPEGIQVIQIAPPYPLKTKRTSQKLKLLKYDYKLGKKQGEKAISKIQASFHSFT